MRNALTVLLALFGLYAVSSKSVAGSYPSRSDSSEPQNTNSSGGLNLRFIDVSTGYAVTPELVDIIQRENPGIHFRLTARDVSARGTCSIQLTWGTYDITVVANGYATMTSYFPIEGLFLNVNFQLDRLVPVRELTPAHLRTLHRDDVMVIVGFVVDDSSGMPLGGVSISSADHFVSSNTNDSGYFELILPLPSTPKEVAGRNNLLVSKVGFTKEIRKNFDMWPNGDMILLIRMKPGQGFIEENIILRRDASISYK